MPYSDTEGKNIALDWYKRIQPATVVDIGAGSGTYAKLMREHHDAHWTAVEAWSPYITEFGLDKLYDEVIVSDARRLNWPTYRADLVIAGDVLEHMTKPDARALIRRMQQGAANIIISVPVLHLPQGAVNGNDYERHVEHWTATAMHAELDQQVDTTVNGIGKVVSTLKESWIGGTLAYFWWQRP